MPKTAAIGAGEASGCKLEFPMMDKVLHASIGRLTGGISPAALSLAYTDWIQHLIASPDKQLEEELWPPAIAFMTITRRAK